MDDVLALVVGFPLLISSTIILMSFKTSTPRIKDNPKAPR
jgi:hypothetical protein